MNVIEADEYIKNRKKIDSTVLNQLDKKVLSLLEHERPLGHPYKYHKSVWETYIGKYRLYYQMDSKTLTLLVFQHKKDQKKLRFKKE